MHHKNAFTNLIASASEDFESMEWSRPLRRGRILIDLIAKDCRKEVGEGDALHSKGERSTLAGAGASSPCCSLCVMLGSLGEETDTMARDDEVVAVPVSMFPSVQVPPNGVSEFVGPATFVAAAAEDVLPVWSGIVSSPQPDPRSVPVSPHPLPEDPHPTGCASHCEDDACSP
jgi:hypothetical protein